MSPEAFVALGAGLAMVKTKFVMGGVRLAVHGKTFATVGWPQADRAVVKLSPDDQTKLAALCAAVTPEPGRRGRKGVTLIDLRPLNDEVATRLLVAAWQTAAAAPTGLSKTA